MARLEFLGGPDTEKKENDMAEISRNPSGPKGNKKSCPPHKDHARMAI